MCDDDIRRRRFSTMYCEPEELQQDDALFRKRIARKIFRFIPESEAFKVAEHLEDELGIIVNYPTNIIAKWENAFNGINIDKLLSAITEVDRHRRNSRYPYNRSTFVKEINRIFQEESMAYYLDENCIVHPKPDEAYRSSYFSTIRGLQSAELEAAAEEIRKADQYLLQESEDWSKAVLSTFMACENVFKVITRKPRLTSQFIQSDLAPLLNLRYSDQPVEAKNFQRELIKSFASWVEACHNYRHAAGQPEPTPPPPELALQAIANGFSFARWLAEISVYSTNSQS